MFGLVKDRKREPASAKVAVRGLRVAAGLCFLSAIWNLLASLLAEQGNETFATIVPLLPYFCVALIGIGALFLLSAGGLADGRTWSIRLGRVAILALAGLFVADRTNESAFSQGGEVSERGAGCGKGGRERGLN